MTGPDWEDTARDELADIWVAATPDERDLIEQIVLDAERDLRKDPYAVGESRGGSYRVLIRPPLTFWYEVMPTGVARIGHVHRHKPRTP